MQIASLQEGQFELVKSLGNLRGVYENLKKSAADFKGVLLDLKIEEGLVKLLNNEFGASVEWLETVLKLPQAKFQGESYKLEDTAVV